LIRILIANIGLPSHKIGSWTNRITRLIEGNPDLFTYILSPTSTPSASSFACKKKKWLPFFPNRFRSWQILNYQAGEYIKAFKNLPIQGKKTQVIVFDDLLLLEAFALLKYRGFSFELVFSFHGHSFVVKDNWIQMVDKVLFLTEAGYKETFQKHQVFTPLVSIVGNGVDSETFYPLSPDQKLQRKRDLGIPDAARVLIWLSNNRPKKGFHLFEKLAQRLSRKYDNLVVLIIGINSGKSEPELNLRYLGKIPNQDLPYYLQIGDFYAFTSLWKEGFGLSLAEAAKCGNRVIASRAGGIPEVVQNLPGAVLIDQPNVLEAWETAFAKVWEEQNQFQIDAEFLKTFHDLRDWEEKYLKALEY
jgi:glycosyltransferase involved in cell wall biosynthesis